MKALKILGIVLGTLTVLLLVGIIYLTTGFGTTRIKSELSRVVLENKQRTLKIDGELTLSFWPSLGVRLGRVSLSDRDSDKTFAAFESAQVSVQAMPLLAKQIVFDRIELDGGQVSLLRRQDGTLNIDDLLAKEKDQAMQFDIGRIKIANTRLSVRDEMSGRDLVLANLNLSAGPLANAARGKLEFSTRLNASQPSIDAAIRLDADYDYDMNARRFDLGRIDVSCVGQLAGARNSIDAKLALSGKLHADLARQSAEGNVSARFDESTIDAKFNLTKFAPLALGFTLDIDRLNADKYLPPKQGGGGKIAAKDGAEKLVLSTVKNLDVHGTVNIGTLQFAGASADNVRLHL